MTHNLKLWQHMAPLLAAALLLAVGPVSAQAPAGSKPAAKSEDLKPCIECHEGFYSIVATKHFVKDDPRTPKAKASGRDEGCDACHGDTSAHQRAPRAKGLVPIVYGKKAPAAQQNETCLSCHQSGSRVHWQGSAHDRAQQSCVGCHRLHAPKDPVTVTETQASVCFDCHKDRRAEMHRLSTHPTKTGFFACSSCHATHGSTTRASLQKPSVNDTCYQCHADKRGPFLWEHRSAQDDCTNCHNPHGTNITPMLKVRAPFLCQQCHQTAQTHSNAAFSGINTVPPGNSTERILGRSCVNCHVKVHGTNHPSGARLQR